MKYLEELKEIEITSLEELKNFLRLLGLKESCINDISEYEINTYRLDRFTINYEINTNLGTLIFELFKLNNLTLYTRLTYWNHDTYKFKRNVNTSYEFKHETVNDLDFQFLER